MSWKLALAAAVSLFANSLVAADRPNVVLIVGDDQAWTDFGLMGHDVIRTPRLDRLAEQSAVFTHGYVPTSLCRASLASILTGLYPHQHGICCNDPPDGVDRAVMHRFIQQSPTLPRLLGDAGYRSFQTGKLWEGHFRNAGFSDGMTTEGRHGDAGLRIGRETMEPIYDFIDSCGDAPFFVWYAPMLPHEPHNPPERILTKYKAPGRPEKLARYYAMCEWFDETCGELLDSLDKRGLADETLVAFVVDNGWIQETGPARTTRGWFAPKSKLSPYDGGLRTPIMLRWPGHVKPGRYDDLASSIDLAPTILAACGAAVPANMPGVDLLPRAMCGDPLSRDAIFGEIHEHTAVDVNNPARNLTHRWCRAGNWKLILPASADESPQLYAVDSDPMEERDLAAAHPERVAELRDRIEAWWPLGER